MDLDCIKHQCYTEKGYVLHSLHNNREFASESFAPEAQGYSLSFYYMDFSDFVPYPNAQKVGKTENNPSLSTGRSLQFKQIRKAMKTCFFVIWLSLRTVM